MLIPKYCPFCNSELQWDENRVDIYCVNNNCDEKNIQKLFYFFTTIDIENFGLPTIRKIYEAGYNTVGDIIQATATELSYIKGIGIDTAIDLGKQFKEKLKDISYPKLGDASGCFEGLGEKTLQLIIYEGADENGNINIDRLEFIKGIGKITANAFIDGSYEFLSWCNKNNLKILTRAKKQIIKEGKLKNKVICFTGIRDKELEQLIIKEGGEIASSFTKNVTNLICKDLNSTSSSMQKAKENNILILTCNEFVDTYNL